jgi:hypothetical protein
MPNIGPSTVVSALAALQLAPGLGALEDDLVKHYQRDGQRVPPAAVQALADLRAMANAAEIAIRDVRTDAHSAASVCASEGRSDRRVDATTAAELLGIKRRAIQRRCGRGSLDAEKVAGVWMISESDIARRKRS